MSVYVHPEMAVILEELRALPPVDFKAMPIEQARPQSDAASAAWSVGAPAIPMVEMTVPGPEPMRGRLYLPREGDDLPLIIFVHGGGWTFGSIETHDGTMRELAVASGCAVFGFDYRLAPEHPFPAPLDDVLAAIAFVEAGGLGPRVDRITLRARRRFGRREPGALARMLARCAMPACPARGRRAVLRLLRADLRHAEPSRVRGQAYLLTASTCAGIGATFLGRKPTDAPPLWPRR